MLIFWALCMSYAHTMINGFIIDELCYIISSMSFIMTPTLKSPWAKKVCSGYRVTHNCGAER